MVAPGPDGKLQQENDSQINNEEHAHPQRARRVLLIDKYGIPFDGTNRVPVDTSGTTVDEQTVIQSIPPTNVLGETEITLITYTVPADYEFYLTDIVVGGDTGGIFTVANGIGNIVTIRTNAAERTWHFSPQRHPRFASGNSVYIRGYNVTPVVRKLEATLMGYIRYTGL